VIVAGAGALGLSTALRLADAGCLVTVCDPAGGPQASAVAAGMLAPVFEAALDAQTAGDLDLMLAARDLWPTLAARAGIVLDRSGTAAVGSQVWLADIGSRLARLGVRGADVPRAMLEEMAPGIAQGLEAVLVREDWRLDPRPALAALRAAAEAAGVEFRPWTVSGRGGADWLVAATGADPGLQHEAPELAALSPIKGQILRFMDVRGGRVSHTAIDPATLAPLSEAAGRMFPGLATATFGASAGVRAATADGLPMVGLSQTPGVILAVGARRNGWLLAPLIAEVVTACITGAESGPYAQRFDPGRFAAAR
jgi:glycine oxidase